MHAGLNAFVMLCCSSDALFVLHSIAVHNPWINVKMKQSGVMATGWSRKGEKSHNLYISWFTAKCGIKNWLWFLPCEPNRSLSFTTVTREWKFEEDDKSCENLSKRRVFPQLFRALPNFYESGTPNVRENFAIIVRSPYLFYKCPFCATQRFIFKR